MMMSIQHPEISNAERTGYPSWTNLIEDQEIVKCDSCHFEIEDKDDVYETDDGRCLCDLCYYDETGSHARGRLWLAIAE